MGTNGTTYRPKRKPSKRKAYFKCNHIVYEDPEFLNLDSCAFKLYTILCKLRNRFSLALEDGTFWHSDTQLIKATAMSRNSVKEGRDQLVKGGYIWCVSYLDERHLGPRYMVLDHLNKPPPKDISDIKCSALPEEEMGDGESMETMNSIPF